MLLLNKLLPVFFLPLGFTILLLLAGILFRKQLLLWYAAGVLYALSMPVVGDGLMRFAEAGTMAVPASSLRPGEAIVVLSGMIRQVDGAPLGEWSDAADRFEGGVRLYRAGKAPQLIFTRGIMPWSQHTVPEGELLARRASQLGIPASAIRLTPPVGNTADEAAAISRMLGVNATSPRTIILVTSAYHMRRSQMLFEQAGFRVIPYHVDFQVGIPDRHPLLDYLPSSRALENSETAIRELIGTMYYWLRFLFH